MALAILALLATGSARAELRFDLVSEEWGLAFRHHHGGCGELYMIETMGSGVAIFDYDGDGDPDVFFVDSGAVPGCEAGKTGSRLFRNDGGGRFADVTDRSRIEVTGYGMGATAGDVDADGDLDLYVTSFGVDQLFLNRGDGTFGDGPRIGDGEPSWSASAAFGDADGDGDLDLYVTSYVDFSFDNNVVCGSPKSGLRSYCHPDVYNGVPDRFYRNLGAGAGGRVVFEDATREAGLDVAAGNGLGVVWSDFDGDGRSDLYVANDMTFNFLFRNLGEKARASFEEVSLLTGTAVGDHGKPEAGMGLGVSDLDGDGRFEIFVTHLDRETNALYGNRGTHFADRRFESGLAEASLFKVGFGAAFADFDHDGDPDLAVANGHIIHNIEKFGTGTTYRQANQLFENTGGGRFREAKDAGLDAVRVSRGLAVGDLDGDRDLDLVISNSNDVAEVYRNASSAGPWLRLDLDVPGADRQGVGARVELRVGGLRQVQEVRTASSYLSQNEMTLHFGLGETAPRSAPELTVRLAGRRAVRVSNLPRDRSLRLRVP